jgi:hypothetical protein
VPETIKRLPSTHRWDSATCLKEIREFSGNSGVAKDGSTLTVETSVHEIPFAR